MQNDHDEVDAELQPFGKMKLPSDFAGQQLFIRGEDWSNNAMLGWTGFNGDIYAAGYKDAADVLVAALIERRASLDSVIYPLVFLYRQGLELQLKLMLPQTRRLANKEFAADHHHDLKRLWNELRQYLAEIDSSMEEELSAVEDIIYQLDTVDPGSMAFRYPNKKTGEQSLPDLHHINVRHLSEVMNSTLRLLNGIYSLLGNVDQEYNSY